MSSTNHKTQVAIYARVSTKTPLTDDITELAKQIFSKRIFLNHTPYTIHALSLPASEVNHSQGRIPSNYRTYEVTPDNRRFLMREADEKKSTPNRLIVQLGKRNNSHNLERSGPWLRMAFAMCATLAGLGTVLASPIFLWILTPIAALAAAFPVHPFDLIYNYGIRHLTATGKLPKRQPPARFACGIGALWLIGTALAFESGALITGYVLGGALTLIATLVSTTDICIPSMIYGAIFGRPQPVVNKTTNIAQ